MFLPIYFLICFARGNCPDSTINFVANDLNDASVSTYKYDNKDDSCPRKSLQFTFDSSIPSTTKKVIPKYLCRKIPISTLTISNEIEEIHDNAFYDCSINTINFEATSKLVSIGSQSFYSVNPSFSTITVNFPASLKIISKQAFMYSGPLSVSFDTSSILDTIGQQAFSNADLRSLSNLEYTKLTQIANKAFYNAGSSSSYSFYVNIPEKVITIGESAFEDSYVQSVSLDGDNPSLGTIGIKAFKNCGRLGSFRFIEDATKLDEIGESAFESTTVTSSNSGITIPSTLRIIGKAAFKKSNLYSFSIPSTNKLEEIRDEAFNSDHNLGSVSNLYYATKLKLIGDSAFFDAYQSQYNTPTYYLPENLETIGSAAFYFESTNYYTTIYLTSISKLEEIGADAFHGQYLKHYDRSNYNSYDFNGIDSILTFPATLTDIGDSAFEGLLNGPYAIDFSKATSLTNIGEKAFYNVNVHRNSILHLKTANLKFIGKRAFQLQNTGYERTFTIQTLNNIEIIGDYPFQNQIVIYPETIVFTDKLYYIGDYALYRYKSGDDPSDVHSKKIKSISFDQTNPIEKIGISAFENQDELRITTNIKAHEIGNRAFYLCTTLNTNVEIVPQDTTAGRIGEYAFFGCNSFAGTLTMTNPTEIDESESRPLSIIDQFAFQNTGITSITLPHMKSIGTSAFQNCIKLNPVSKDLYVDDINSNAFKDCIILVLSKITATNINSNAFENCHALNANIEILYGGKIASKAFYCCDNLGTLSYNLSYIDDAHSYTEQTIGSEAFHKSGLRGPLTIPHIINEIGSYAFASCDNIGSLTIESNLTTKQTIKNNAFYYSNIGKQLVIPASVIKIEDKAFAFTGINTLTIEGTNYLKYSGSTPSPDPIEISTNAFYYCRSLSTLKFGNGYAKFDSSSFKGCPLSTVDLGQIVEIPTEAFYGVTSLRNINIPETVEKIKAKAFAECTNLESVNFTANSRLDTIEREAFYKCGKLSKTSIPNRVKIINPYTYYKCSVLPLPAIPPKVTTIDEFAFYQCRSFSGTLTLPGELDTIGESAFEGCTDLSGSLILPDSLSKVDKRAFIGCNKFTGNLEFGRSIGTIGESAFRDCTGFNQQLTFPDFLTSSSLTISEGAFYGCSGFTGNLDLPNGATLSKNAFRGCSGFNGNLYLPSSVTTVSEGAFYGCSGFIGEIPLEHVTQVDKYAFYDCSSFNGSLNFDKIGSASAYSFYNCRGLNGELISSNGLSTVEKYAFYGCSHLTGELNCDSFTKIERHAFEGCSGLTGSLHFKDTLEDIEEYAFAGCSGFSDHLSFKVKGTSKINIEQRAFKDCSGFKNGRLTFTFTEQEESNTKEKADAYYYYKYSYFLKIGNEAFEGTKFKDVYYVGRFEPDCDYDIGISKTKGIHTSSNYANKTFCNYPLHKSKLSGGAIAGIVIAVIVVVAAIVILIVFLILRNKKNKDNSEAEVEMNQDP